VLSEAGLVALISGGRLDWRAQGREAREPSHLADGAMSDAAAQLDTVIADLDRLLARTAR
jgi:hypothetical protein